MYTYPITPPPRATKVLFRSSFLERAASITFMRVGMSCLGGWVDDSLSLALEKRWVGGLGGWVGLP